MHFTFAVGLPPQYKAKILSKRKNTSSKPVKLDWSWLPLHFSAAAV